MKMLVHVPTNRVVGCHMVRGGAGSGRAGGWAAGPACRGRRLSTGAAQLLQRPARALNSSRLPHPSQPAGWPQHRQNHARPRLPSYFSRTHLTSPYTHPCTNPLTRPLCGPRRRRGHAGPQLTSHRASSLHPPASTSPAGGPRRRRDHAGPGRGAQVRRHQGAVRLVRRHPPQRRRGVGHHERPRAVSGACADGKERLGPADRPCRAGVGWRRPRWCAPALRAAAGAAAVTAPSLSAAAALACSPVPSPQAGAVQGPVCGAAGRRGGGLQGLTAALGAALRRTALVSHTAAHPAFPSPAQN